MTPEDKALIEAMFYIFLILSAPFLLKLGYYLSFAFFSKLFPVTKVCIKYELNGAKVVKVIDARDSKKIINTLAEIDQGNPGHVENTRA